MIYYQNTTDITDAITRSATADTQKHQRGACIHTIQSTADDGHARSGSLAAEHRVPISVSSAANGAAPKKQRWRSAVIGGKGELSCVVPGVVDRIQKSAASQELLAGPYRPAAPVR